MDGDAIFERLVREHQEMVFRTLFRLVGSREHLDDLAQEVFLRLLRAWPQFRGEALLTTYLYRIAVNVAQDEWKRRKKERESTVSISEETTDWENQWLGAGGAEGVMVAEVLDPKLKPYEGRTIAAIAAAEKKDPRDVVIDIVLADRANAACIIARV